MLSLHGPGSAVPHLWKGPQQAREVWDIAASKTGENPWESMKIYQKDEWQMVNIRMFGIGLARVCFDTSMWKSGRVGKKTNKFWLNSTMPKFYFLRNNISNLTFAPCVSEWSIRSLFSGPRPKMSCVPFGSGDLRENKGRATWPLHDFWVWMFPLRKTLRSKQTTVACRFETKQFGGGKMWSFGVDLDECDISSVVIFVSSSIDP